MVKARNPPTLSLAIRSYRPSFLANPLDDIKISQRDDNCNFLQVEQSFTYVFFLTSPTVPPYFARLTLIVYEMAVKSLYSCLFMECCFQDLCKTARSIVGKMPVKLFVYPPNGNLIYLKKNKQNWNFFQAIAISVLLCTFTTRMQTERMEKKLNENYARTLRAVLNTFCKQQLRKLHLYGHLPPISQTIQVRRCLALLKW